MNKASFSEVYQIIQYLPENEYKKIPNETIEYIKRNMDSSFSNICNINYTIEDISLSSEAKSIFLALYYEYIANDTQKIKLKNFLVTQEQLQSSFSYNELFDNKNLKNETSLQKNTALVPVEEISWFKKIKNKILNFIKNIKNN